MDRWIRIALDRAAVVREVYARVANVNHPPEWHPLQVICEQCGKVGTTIVTGWDAERETVTYECRPDLVRWASGCGRAGETTPFGGAAKLPFNVDWAAKWSEFGVTIEPNGKDLATRGGARDRSEAIAREVFDRTPPLNLVYEFLNIGGRKMSTSKGTGASASRMAEVVPPEQLRLLFLRPRPNQAINFDPDGTDAIPRLFDESDRLAAATAGHEVRGELPADAPKLFAASLVDPASDVAATAALHRPPFNHLALLVQVPGVDVAERTAAEKGDALTDAERALLDERVTAARVWLEAYAPERVRVAVQDELPPAVTELDDPQRAFLAALDARLAADVAWTGEALQNDIFEAARGVELPAGRAFAALYLAFLGQPSGPRAGWLLASLDRALVVERLRAAAAPGRLDA
jgi:lysyl-tRNA synthetase class 1